MLDDLLEVLVRQSNLRGYFSAFLAPLAWSTALTVIGAALCSRLDPRRRSYLAPAAPAIGFLMVSLVLSNVGLLFGARQPVLLWLVLGASVVLIVRMPDLWRESLVGWVPGLLVGFVAVAGLALLPMARTSDGNTLNHPTTNHDAFFYASTQEWVAGNRYLLSPSIDSQATADSDPPGYASATAIREFNLRVGESLVGAFLDPTLSSTEVVDWYRTRTAWLFVGFSLFLSAGSLLGLSRLGAVIAAFVGVGSWQSIFQMYNQNAPALVGLSIVPAMVAVGVAVRRQSADRRDLLQFAAFLIAGLMAVYSELLPLAVVGFLFFLASRAEFAWTRLRSLAVTGAAALALAPYSAYQAVKTNLRVGGLVNALGAPLYWDRSPGEIVTLLFGVNWTINGIHVGALAALAILVAGLLRLTLRTGAPAAVLLPLSVLVVVVILGRRGSFYSLDRLVQTMSPTVLWLAATGLVLEAPARVGRRLASLAPASLLVALSIAAPFNFLASQSPLDWRTTAPSLEEAVNGARRVSGDGSEVMFHSNQYLDRLWASLDLLDAPRTEFSYLSPDYFHVSGFDDADPDGFLLTNITPVGRDADAIETRGNYRLYATSGSVMGLLVPTSMETTQLDDGSLSVPPGHAFRLMLWSSSGNIRVTLSIGNAKPGSEIRGQSGASLGVVDAKGRVELTLTPGTTVLFLQSADLVPAEVAIRSVGVD